jgi:hypothetical protein
MVSSVFRSHFELVAERDNVCHSAVFRMNGAFGTKNFSTADGEDSIVAV